jgi:hypothetical protein
MDSTNNPSILKTWLVGFDSSIFMDFEPFVTTDIEIARTFLNLLREYGPVLIEGEYNILFQDGSSAFMTETDKEPYAIKGHPFEIHFDRNTGIVTTYWK